MPFIIQDIRFHVLPMRTRFPFKYGIASMSALPHLFVSVDMRVDGGAVTGLASEGLPPKWFTKDPATRFEEDLAEMLAVIQNASRIAQNAAGGPLRFFEFWQALSTEQSAWAKVKQVPPLLANLGVSLIERAVLDGLCKAVNEPLHVLVRSGRLAIDLGKVREELRGISPADFLPEKPREMVFVRHTVGLGDPLRAADLAPEDHLQDGLPYTLDECIRAYGLRYFKVKVSGNPDVDIPRLRIVTTVITENCADGFKATLDGNEQFHDLAGFCAFYETLAKDPGLKPLFDNLILLEQPLHRSHALDDDVGAALRNWKQGPGMIIDESDGSLGDLPKALALGYRGASHKNCKSVVKGLANAALLHLRGRENPQLNPILSGEDLGNVGPVALLQDLAMMALLGVSHVERNGHHYFKGLSMHLPAVQADTLRAHPDLYRPHDQGFPALDIRGGQISLESVNAAPFGCGVRIDASLHEPLEKWVMRGGMGEL